VPAFCLEEFPILKHYGLCVVCRTFDVINDLFFCFLQPGASTALEKPKEEVKAAVVHRVFICILETA
jgi:hypothetical protein